MPGSANTNASREYTRWVERAFSRRECVRFVPSGKDINKCGCGHPLAHHKTHGVESTEQNIREVWSPAYHTSSSPTDAYGTIDFLGGPHPNKAQYIRLSNDSRPDLILQLLTREWALELPKLVISVHGGKANFELNAKLKSVLHKGLLRAAKTTGAWIFTGGANTGVTRHVGDALISERSPRLRGGRVVSIGIAPWGVIENRETLVGCDKDVTYLSIDQPRSKFQVLNNRHAYFLLADNGTVCRYGAELVLRRKLEKYISSQKIPARICSPIPVVCLVIEGGMNTIRTVLDYVTDSPPVPVVVVEGSGRAADLLAIAFKYAAEGSLYSSKSSVILDGMLEPLMAAIQRTFSVEQLQAEKLLNELLQCVKKKHLITIFKPSDSDITGDGNELDHAILSALFRSRHLSTSEQLCLALAWNRVDIARSEIFVYGQEWVEGALEDAMMEALAKNRVDFVKLLLEAGVQMTKFLTIQRLEELYNSKHGTGNTLGMINHIFEHIRARSARLAYHDMHLYTLLDIGLVVNMLMGGAYRSTYTRHKFRLTYMDITNTNNKRPRKISTPQQFFGISNSITRKDTPNSLNGEYDQLGKPDVPGFLFSQPFNELLVWAVLTKRQDMAKLMWQHGEEALAKALVASKLYRAMAKEAADDDLDVGVYEEMRQYSTEFDKEALDLLDYSYRQDDDLAKQLLTCDLPNWSRQTCLRLAVACHHRELLSHPCSQLILGDIWFGGLRTRHASSLHIILGLLFPPWILRLGFKSKEELELLPQTEEEYLMIEEWEENTSKSSHSSGYSSPSNSPRNSLRRISEVLESDVGNRSISPNAMRSRMKLLTPALETAEGTTIINDQPPDSIQGEKIRELGIRRKLYEFYAAPVTKFWSWSLSYYAFLVVFTYTLLIRTPETPEWNEYFVLLYLGTFGCEKIREILAAEPVKLSHKLSVWSSDTWNLLDAAFVIEIFIALAIRMQGGYLLDVGRVLYGLNSIYWYIRILKILMVFKFLGPFVHMIGNMVGKMIYYVVLMLVMILSYGVFRQCILFPHEPFSWWLVRDIFYKPYFMIYGEVFADTIDPPCGDRAGGEFLPDANGNLTLPNPDWIECQTGRWLNPLVMTCYLLVSFVLLLNMLIAVFNDIFARTSAISHQIWKFNRFGVVMEYEQKPILPPPLIVFSHLYLLIKWCRRRFKGKTESFDYGLKLFLDEDDLERLYDFEEECMEGLVREREAVIQLSTDERVRLIRERLDVMGSKLDDTQQDRIGHNESLQSIELRLMRLEETVEQLNTKKSRDQQGTIKDRERLLDQQIARLERVSQTIDAVQQRTISNSSSLNLRSSPVSFQRQLTEDTTSQFENLGLFEENTVRNDDNQNDPDSSLDDVPDSAQNSNKIFDFQRSLSVTGSVEPGLELRHRLRYLSEHHSVADGNSIRSNPSSPQIGSKPLVYTFSEPVEVDSVSLSRENSETKNRRARLQTMLSFPPDQQLIPGENDMYQVRPSSSSYGSIPATSPMATESTSIPKIALPVITVSTARNRPCTNTLAAANVEAEAEHLREIECEDYEMMEDIISQRLCQDSENENHTEFQQEMITVSNVQDSEQPPFINKKEEKNSMKKPTRERRLPTTEPIKHDELLADTIPMVPLMQKLDNEAIVINLEDVHQL